MRTVRLRLTLLYGGLFVASGAVLVALVYVLVAHTSFGELPTPPVPDLPGPALAPPGRPVLDPALQGQLDQQRADDLRRLLVSSLGALAIMAVASMFLGWVVAGRVLRPLGDMTTAVRAITADRLDRRLAAGGPDDELKRLADTFDDLLDRVQHAFDAQRHFIANASHELRTPLTLQRTLVEVALADPGAGTDALRAALRRVLAAGQHQERLIDALLVLAKGQQGMHTSERLDLAAMTRRALGALPACDVVVTADLDPAAAAGDGELIAQLIGNLLDNAVRHNTAPGWVRIATLTSGGRAVLRITNSGPPIPPEDIERLQRPFQRMRPERTASPTGHGLGLSIVAAVARAHAGELQIEPGPEGGLAVTVTLPGGAEHRPKTGGGAHDHPSSSPHARHHR